MDSKKVIIIAFQEQDNLGVGYICSCLIEAGFHPLVIDFRFGKETILSSILSYEPTLVGFSIIFQHHISEIKELISFLRENGIQCHFCAGGHFPSLRPGETLRMIDGLDSVALFEGEYTFIELAKAIYSGGDWRQIEGIAYREDNSIKRSPLRAVEKDLDRFPFPLRPPLREFVLGKKFATLLASRGCLYNCSFCSIREFYSRSSGPAKRVRKPDMVVEEMAELHGKQECSIFMFQDDDFPLAGAKGRDWIIRFCRLLHESGLDKRIMWKVNCRPDEVECDLFGLMKESGLFLVYLGIESGTDVGLSLMNKHMGPDIGVCAVNALKKLGIDYDYGFMLFHPSTTLQLFMKDLEFLEIICGDGSAPISFCRMLPYAETEIERILLRTGRLKGDLGNEDYDSCDPLVDRMYGFIQDCFYEWIGTRDGLLNICKWIKYYRTVFQKYYAAMTQFEPYEGSIRAIIQESNAFILNTLREIGNFYLNRKGESEYSVELDIIKTKTASFHDGHKRKAEDLMLAVEGMI